MHFNHIYIYTYIDFTISPKNRIVIIWTIFCWCSVAYTYITPFILSTIRNRMTIICDYHRNINMELTIAIGIYLEVNGIQIYFEED